MNLFLTAYIYVFMIWNKLCLAVKFRTRNAHCLLTMTACAWGIGSGIDKLTLYPDYEILLDVASGPNTHILF